MMSRTALSSTSWPVACVAIGLLAGCDADVGLSTYDTPPSATISEPGAKTVGDEGTSVDFVGRVADDADVSQLIVEWESDLDGVLSGGDVDAEGLARLTTANLSAGAHAVTLSAVDASGGIGRDTVSVTIIDQPEAPQVTIVRPIAGEKLLEDDPYDFVILVEDAHDAPEDLIAEIGSDREGRCTASLGAGTHLLTAVAIDLDGELGEATAYVDVQAADDVDDDLDGFTENQGDCNDDDDEVYPGQTEVPYDGVDNDCLDGDLVDQDGDGHAAEIVGGDDCDDLEELVAPSVPELPYDGVDNDCDPLTSDDDLDGDGSTGDVDCDDANPDESPDFAEIPYDGHDNDCDAATPDDDLDFDGFGIALDCADDDQDVNPAEDEIPYDEIDNDCDPATLDDDLDQDGFDHLVDCNDNDPTVNPSRVEQPYDGKDNDCNPNTLDDDLDEDGYPQASDCNDLDPLSNPGLTGYPRRRPRRRRSRHRQRLQRPRRGRVPGQPGGPVRRQGQRLHGR